MCSPKDAVPLPSVQGHRARALTSITSCETEATNSSFWVLACGSLDRDPHRISASLCLTECSSCIFTKHYLGLLSAIPSSFSPSGPVFLHFGNHYFSEEGLASMRQGIEARLSWVLAELKKKSECLSRLLLSPLEQGCLREHELPGRQRVHF